MASFTVTKTNINPNSARFFPSKDNFLKLQNLKKNIKMETFLKSEYPDLHTEPNMQITKYSGPRKDIEKLHTFLTVENTEYIKYCTLNNITRTITEIIK